MIRNEINELVILFNDTDFSIDDTNTFYHIKMDYSYYQLDLREKYGDNIELVIKKDIYYIRLNGYINDDSGDRVKLTIQDTKGISKYCSEGNSSREIELSEQEKSYLQGLLTSQYLRINTCYQEKMKKKKQDKLDGDTQLLREIIEKRM